MYLWSTKTLDSIQLIFTFYRVSPAHRPKPIGSTGRNRSFPLTQLPTRMDTIPPPQRFQNDCAPLINGLPDPIHTATQTTLVRPLKYIKKNNPWTVIYIYGTNNNDFRRRCPIFFDSYYTFSLKPNTRGRTAGKTTTFSCIRLRRLQDTGSAACLISTVSTPSRPPPGCPLGLSLRPWSGTGRLKGESFVSVRLQNLNIM